MKIMRSLVLAGLLAVGGLAAATPVHADTTYNINTTADTPSGFGGAACSASPSDCTGSLTEQSQS